MLSLTYVSTPLIPVADRPNVLDDLQAGAIASNSALDITGILLATPLYFAEWLEGPDGNVRAVLERNLADPRHHDLRVIRKSFVEARRIPTWRMVRFEGEYFGDAGITPLLAAAHDEGGRDAARRLDRLFDAIAFNSAGPAC